MIQIERMFQAVKPLACGLAVALAVTWSAAPAEAGGRKRSKKKRAETTVETTVESTESSTTDSWSSGSWSSGWTDWTALTQYFKDAKDKTIEGVDEVAAVLEGDGTVAEQVEDTANIVVETTDEVVAIVDDALEYIGNINPTNVPIVTSDFLDFAVVPEDMLVTELAHQKVTGAGVVVAVLDGGFAQPSAAMARQMSPDAFDAVDEDSYPFSDPFVFDDKYKDKDGQNDQFEEMYAVSPGLGHGTFVADMVLKVAPGATILPIRVADDLGRVRADWIHRGIEHAMNHGANVINLSLEMSALDKDTSDMLLKAVMRGIIIVVAAGNDGSNEAWGALADSGLTLAVGAVDQNGCIAPFSNFGKQMFENIVFAPGVDLVGTCGFPERDSQCVWSGTSFATGLVSGAVALEHEQSKGMLSMFIPLAIRAAVNPVYTESGAKLDGAGVINLEKLLAR